jgi:hypothetical protein
VGIAAGIALSVAALIGIRPRLCFAASTLLYLSYATAGRTFLSFQWDNLLLECGLLATFLPARRPARWVHFLFRVLLFKLYWESGVAKWLSHINDWQDGSAMVFYYETAPLPTWLAWYAHWTPAWWHHLESWGALVLELGFPLAIFAPRWPRLIAAVAFTGFQILNAATANYGFFVYLTVALHVFLLADSDLVALRMRLPIQARRSWSVSQPTADGEGTWRHRLVYAAAVAATALYLLISAVDAHLQFGPRGAWQAELAPLAAWYDPWRLINTYHLFGHITRERIEPELQTSDGSTWQPHDLHYKPGALARAPAFVAPHQPRVDFQLWFYGLSFRRGQPAYLQTLLDRVCRDPTAVQPLFASALPMHPAAVRLVFWQYHFTTPEERRSTGAWWRRDLVATMRPLSCPAGAS